MDITAGMNIAWLSLYAALDQRHSTRVCVRDRSGWLQISEVKTAPSCSSTPEVVL